MAALQFSQLAEADFLEIGSYTLQNWGMAQALAYVGQLENACQRLADRPVLGRLCENIRPGLRRMEQGRHVIFYRPHEDGILVSRILHQCMLPGHHDMDGSN